MIMVGTASLKNNLSAYLKKIKKGGRIMVTDRGEPVALLLPVDSKSELQNNEEKLAALVSGGTVEYSFSTRNFSHPKPIKLMASTSISGIISSMRDDS
jgi:prevent-host-death family protein